MSLAIAAVTLADRAKRRRFITGLLVFVLAYFALGNWGIDSWLEQGPWRMLIYWGFMLILLLLLVLFAVFDALAAIGEERRKMGLKEPTVEDDSEQD